MKTKHLLYIIIALQLVGSYISNLEIDDLENQIQAVYERIEAN